MKSFKFLAVVFFSLTNILSAEWNLDRIIAKDREKIIQFIKEFPPANYQAYFVPGNGYFYIDPIDDLIKSFLRRGAPWEEHIQRLIRDYSRPGSWDTYAVHVTSYW